MPRKRRILDQTFSPAVVLGGRGRMGEWYVRFLAAQGIDAKPWDRSDSTPLDQVLGRSRLVFLSLPMSAAIEMAPQICPLLKPGQLLVDACSVKTPVVQAFEPLLPAGVEFLALHTMFGPWIELESEENVICLRSPRVGPLAQQFAEYFARAGFRLHWTDAAEHDRMTACTQTLMHFVLFALADTLDELGANRAALEPYLTPNSRDTLESIERVLKQSPDLSANIQRLNPFGPAAREQFLKAAANLQAKFNC